MSRKIKEKGITLVALVVTIIILMILAGTTINLVLGDNGIIKMAKRAREKTEEASDEEIINMQMMLIQMNAEEANVGTTLYDKKFENNDKWHLVIEDENQYGTGYTYFKKGTNVGGSILSSSWIINNKTGEMKKLEEGKYVELSVSDSLGTEKGLIFNLDPSMIEGSEGKTISEIEKELGTGVTLEGFDETSSEESGLTSKSFNFDGKDDRIKILYNERNKKDELEKNGFTFEFYGKWNGGTSHSSLSAQNSYKGLFCYYPGDDNGKAGFRFGIFDDDSKKTFAYNCGGDTDFFSDFSNTIKDPWNIFFKYDIEKLKNDTYIAVTLDTFHPYTVSGGKYKDSSGKDRDDIKEEKQGEYYKQTFYVNGKKLYEGDFNKKQWDNFVTNWLPNAEYFCIGSSIMGNAGAWCYSKMNAYCLRLYNRGLSEEEVMTNYKKTKEYYSLL